MLFLLLLLLLLQPLQLLPLAALIVQPLWQQRLNLRLCSTAAPPAAPLALLLLPAELAQSVLHRGRRVAVVSSVAAAGTACFVALLASPAVSLPPAATDVTTVQAAVAGNHGVVTGVGIALLVASTYAAACGMHSASRKPNTLRRAGAPVPQCQRRLRGLGVGQVGGRNAAHHISPS